VCGLVALIRQVSSDAFEERLGVGCVYLLEFSREAIRAVKGRIVGGGAEPVSLYKVKHFFEARSLDCNANVNNDIIAISSTPYKKIISSVRISAELGKLHSNSVVLDYGCGTGGFLKELRIRGYRGRYIGYDLDQVSIENLQKKCGDSLADFRYSSSNLESFDLAFLCNVLVYNQEAEVIEILRRLRNAISHTATLVIIEPYPKWYWEFKFDGLCLAPRRHEQLREIVRMSGWEIVGSVDVSIAAATAVTLFPIAYSLVAQGSSVG